MVYLPNSRGTSELHPDKTPGWNELHFINREEFADMAPSVLQLEVSRLTRLLPSFELGSDAYNSVISARKSVVHLQSCIQEEMDEARVKECSLELESAILCLSASDRKTNPNARRVLVYVADRLVYILGQLKHLY